MKLVKKQSLIEAIRNLKNFNESEIFYVEKEWNHLSRTFVYQFDEEADVPLEIEGVAYFLEVPVICEVIDVWNQWNKKKCSIESECEAVIYYAKNDSYKPAV
jgi:hypothetical protein